MSALELRTTLAAHEAAEALTALGWPVRLAEGDFTTWRIGDFELTNEELIELATRRGIRLMVERVQ